MRKLTITLLFFLVATSQAQAHQLPTKPVKALTLRAQAQWYEKNITHARYTIRFWHKEGAWTADAKRYPRAYHLRMQDLRFHRVLLRNALRNLHAVRAKLNPRPVVDSCLHSLIQRESGWRVTATNPFTGAYGLPQALPGWKMATAGADWATNAATQIRWMLGYIAGRYGSTCNALYFQIAHGWY